MHFYRSRYIKNVIFLMKYMELSHTYAELTDYYVCDNGSCHNGCILDIFDQVVHYGPLFFPRHPLRQDLF